MVCAPVGKGLIASVRAYGSWLTRCIGSIGTFVLDLSGIETDNVSRHAKSFQTDNGRRSFIYALQMAQRAKNNKNLRPSFNLCTQSAQLISNTDLLSQWYQRQRQHNEQPNKTLSLVGPHRMIGDVEHDQRFWCRYDLEGYTIGWSTGQTSKQAAKEAAAGMALQWLNNASCNQS